MSLPYNFEKDAIPDSYRRLDWTERQERIPNDFGEPHRTDPKDWLTFTDWERSEDHLLAEIF